VFLSLIGNEEKLPKLPRLLVGKQSKKVALTASETYLLQKCGFKVPSHIKVARYSRKS